MQGVRLSETQYKRAKVLLATYNRAQVRKFCNMSATTTNRVANSSSYEEYLNVKREEMRKYSQNKVSKSDPRHSSEISPEVFGQIIAAHAFGVSIAALSRSSGFSTYILSHIVKSPNYEEWRKTISNDISKFREKKEGRLSLLEQRVERLETLTQNLIDCLKKANSQGNDLLPVEISQGM